jgi:hypothetical protein
MPGVKRDYEKDPFINTLSAYGRGLISYFSGNSKPGGCIVNMAFYG